MSTHTKTLVAVVGVILGIVCGEISMFASEIAVGAGLLAVAQMGVYFFEVRSERKRKRVGGVIDTTNPFSFSLITILFSLGLLLGIIRSQLVEEKIKYVCESSCTFEADIVSSPEIKNEYQIFNVHPSEGDSNMYDVQVRTSLYPKYKIGEEVTLSGKVIVPNVIMSHSNELASSVPGTKKNSNRGFDYASYLQTKNVGSEMTYPHLEVIDSEAHTVPVLLGRWKEDLFVRIDMRVAQPASSLASGMLFGASSLSQELLQTFRAAGLSHIIVLSGFNIVIVIASILFVLAFLPLVLRITLASISVVVFVIMVGGTPSVIRATLMAFIALLALLFGRVYVARQALILSLFAIVMYEPYALMHDVSLHLSFLATMGLVYMSGRLELLVTKYCRRITLRGLKEILITSCAAYFATLPYVMYTFGSVSVYALIANILVVPLVPLAMLVSFLVVVSSYLSDTLSLFFGFVDTLGINFIIAIAQLVESLPFSTITITISFGVMWILYLFIFIGLNFLSLENETEGTDKDGNLTGIISY